MAHGALTPIIGLRLLALAAGLRHNAEIGQPGLCFSAYGHKFGINHLAQEPRPRSMILRWGWNVQSRASRSDKNQQRGERSSDASPLLVGGSPGLRRSPEMPPGLGRAWWALPDCAAGYMRPAEVPLPVQSFPATVACEQHNPRGDNHGGRPGAGSVQRLHDAVRERPRAAVRSAPSPR